MSELLNKLFFYSPTTTYSDDMFDTMWEHNSTLFLQTIFYLRHHRRHSADQENQISPIPTLKQTLQKVVGRGQRKIFYQVIRWMSYHHLPELIQLIPYIPDHGYWKDLLMLLGTPAEDTVIDLFAHQLQLDYKTFHEPIPGLISMASKWTPNEKSSFDRKYQVFTKIAQKIKVSKKELRTQYLVPLRKYLSITEQMISSQKWSTINYNMVPHRSFGLHHKSFQKHDRDRYNDHLNRTHVDHIDRLILPPLVNSILKRNNFTLTPTSSSSTGQLIPRSNALYAIDTSGSMMGVPITIGACLGVESGTSTWIPYRFEGDSDGKFNELEGSTYIHKINAILNIPVENPYFGFNLETCIKLFQSTTKTHLIIVTNTLLDPSELPSIASPYHLTYWSINTNPVVITTLPNCTMIEGYDINVYLELRDGHILTPSSYRDIILETALRNNDIPSI